MENSGRELLLAARAGDSWGGKYVRETMTNEKTWEGIQWEWSVWWCVHLHALCALFYRLIHLGNYVNQLQKRDHKNSAESNLHGAVFQSCRSVLGAKVAYEVGLLRYDKIIITVIFPNAEILII